MKDIGARVKAIRLAKGLTQIEVSRRSGLICPYISRLENNHLVPTLKVLETLAKAFKIEFYQLFYDGHHPRAAVTIERECAERIREAIVERDRILKKIKTASLRFSKHLGSMSRLVASGLGIRQIAPKNSRECRATPKRRTPRRARRRQVGLGASRQHTRAGARAPYANVARNRHERRLQP
jgi:transcriptional regulator with XRE-family HTH domain